MVNHSPGEYARRTQFTAARQALRADRSLEGLVQLSQRALEFTQKMMSVVAERSTPPDCQAGCAHCCYLMATVSGPEALSIANRLQSELSSQELRSLMEKIKSAYQATRRMDNRTRAQSGIACPFLTRDGLCSIYGYRPLDCASHHSLAVQACQEVLDHPQQRPPTNALMSSIGTGIKTGLGQAINQAGLERPALRYELIEAVHICLHDRRAAEKYLAGKNPLYPAAIMIDPHDRVSFKIKHAPPHLKEQAQNLIAAERRSARRLKD